MIAVAATGLLAGSLVFAAEATIGNDGVRLREIADLAPLPATLREKAGELRLARIAPSTDVAIIPVNYLAARARARMPALSPWLPLAQPGTVRVRRMAVLGVPVINEARAVKGAMVTVKIDLGAFAVERQGTALSGAGPGQRLFVRTSNGQVIVAHCRESAR